MNQLAVAILANAALGAVMLALLWRLRGRPPVPLADAGEAERRLAVLLPDLKGTITLADDGRAALVDGSDGTVGVLLQCGRRWNARRIGSADLRSVRLEGERIKLRFADFAWPRAELRLADPAVRATWAARLQHLDGSTSVSQELDHA
ncbi:MAG: hypothetical protein KGL34_13630 [Gammaproteobacteria bacterium]|nr:hypothetical protein [Gammaproteobacteria bacterium]